DIPKLADLPQGYVEAFFGAGLDQVGSATFSHQLRWRTTGRLRRLLSPGVREAAAEVEAADLQRLLGGQGDWHPVSRAQHVEAATFLDPYLLASQGDRMTMAHSVEGRFPFL